MQALPKLPAFAIMATNRGALTVPDTSTNFGLLGSLLNTVIVAAFGPRLLGWNRIGTSIAFLLQW
jgi:hypothetical protein